MTPQNEPTINGRLELPQLRLGLERWYQARSGLDHAQVISLSAPDSGAVNETYLCSILYLVGAKQRSVQHVIRIQPLVETPIPDVDVLAQARTLEGLSRIKAVPTPQVLWVEPDIRWLGTPFFVMERLPGIALFDVGRVPNDAAAMRSLYDQTIRALAAIHQADWSHGLAHLEQRHCGLPPLEQQLLLYRGYLTTSSEGARYSLLERAYDWLAEHLPTNDNLTLNWGDARVGNLLFDGSQLTAVLDWEIASIVPREVDIGWFLYFERFLWTDGVDLRPGAPSRDKILQDYEELAGTGLADLKWYERWAAFRMALMRMRAGRQQIARGQASSTSRIDEINFASVEMADLFGFPKPQ